MSEDLPDVMVKLLILGDMSVGKSSILNSYLRIPFNTNIPSTIGIDYKINSTTYKGRKIKVQLWDSAGQERFKCYTKIYYRGAHGIILVYDVNDKESVENLSTWMKEMKNEFEDRCVIVFGNKIDLYDDIKLPEVDTFKYPHHLVSAKNSEGISGPIDAMVKKIARELIFPKTESDSSGSQSFSIFPIVITPEKEKSTCCN